MSRLVKIGTDSWITGDWVQSGLKQQFGYTADCQAARMRGLHVFLKKRKEVVRHVKRGLINKTKYFCKRERPLFGARNQFES